MIFLHSGEATRRTVRQRPRRLLVLLLLVLASLAVVAAAVRRRGRAPVWHEAVGPAAPLTPLPEQVLTPTAPPAAPLPEQMLTPPSPPPAPTRRAERRVFVPTAPPPAPPMRPAEPDDERSTLSFAQQCLIAVGILVAGLVVVFLIQLLLH